MKNKVVQPSFVDSSNDSNDDSTSKEGEQKIDSPKNKYSALLVTFAKIFIALLIVCAFDNRWRSCFNSETIAQTCRREGCQGTNHCFDNYPCGLSGSGTSKNCVANSTANSGYTCEYSDTLENYSCDASPGSYCEYTRDSTCLCASWLALSFSIVMLNVGTYILQLLLVCCKGYDPMKVQYEHIEAGNYRWLFHLWHTWVGCVDLGYLIGAAILQIFAVSTLECADATSKQQVILIEYFLVITIKEAYKINLYLSLRDWRAGNSWQIVCKQLLRFDLTLYHYIIILVQGTMCAVSLGLLCIPFYMTPYYEDENENVALLKATKTSKAFGAKNRSRV